MQLQFLAQVEFFFFSSWSGYSYWPGRNCYFSWYTVLPLCGLSCLHFYQDGQIQPILEGQMLGTVHIMECTCSQAWKVLHLFLSLLFLCLCLHVLCVLVCVVCVVSLFLVVFGASAMKVNAWTCAPATASDLESAWRSISIRTRRMLNCAWKGWRANRSLHLGTEAKDSWFPPLFPSG